MNDFGTIGNGMSMLNNQQFAGSMGGSSQGWTGPTGSFGQPAQGGNSGVSTWGSSLPGATI